MESNYIEPSEYRKAEIKPMIERSVKQFQDSPEVKRMYKLIREERYDRRQQVMVDYVAATDRFVNKMITMATFAHVNSEISRAILGNYEYYVYKVNEAGALINKQLEEIDKQTAEYVEDVNFLLAKLIPEQPDFFNDTACEKRFNEIKKRWRVRHEAK